MVQVAQTTTQKATVSVLPPGLSEAPVRYVCFLALVVGVLSAGPGTPLGHLRHREAPPTDMAEFMKVQLPEMLTQAVGAALCIVFGLSSSRFSEPTEEEGVRKVSVLPPGLSEAPARYLCFFLLVLGALLAKPGMPLGQLRHREGAPADAAPDMLTQAAGAALCVVVGIASSRFSEPTEEEGVRKISVLPPGLAAGPARYLCFFVLIFGALLANPGVPLGHLRHREAAAPAAAAAPTMGLADAAAEPKSVQLPEMLTLAAGAALYVAFGLSSGRFSEPTMKEGVRKISVLPPGLAAAPARYMCFLALVLAALSANPGVPLGHLRSAGPPQMRLQAHPAAATAAAEPTMGLADVADMDLLEL